MKAKIVSLALSEDQADWLEKAVAEHRRVKKLRAEMRRLSRQIMRTRFPDTERRGLPDRKVLRLNQADGVKNWREKLSREGLARISHTQLDPMHFTASTEPSPQKSPSGQGVWLRDLGSDLWAPREKDFLQKV